MIDFQTLRQWLANYAKASIEVRHSELERHGESPYRSKCPACLKGLLLVRRDQETFELLANDRCIRCGQRVIYLDEMINGEPVKR